jgi:hypothetical protein
MAPSGPRREHPLLDHLVGGGQQRFRDGDAERFGGLEVDDEFEFVWFHSRQVGGFLSPFRTRPVRRPFGELIRLFWFRSSRALRSQPPCRAGSTATPRCVPTLCDVQGLLEIRLGTSTAPIRGIGDVAHNHRGERHCSRRSEGKCSPRATAPDRGGTGASPPRGKSSQPPRPRVMHEVTAAGRLAAV